MFSRLLIQMERYDDLKKEFLAVKKRICKTKLSTNPDKLNEYERDIIAAHDDIVSCVSEFIGDLDKEDTEFFRGELVYVRDRTIECFGRLKLRIVVSTDLLSKIDAERFSESDDSEQKSNLDDQNTSTYIDASEASLDSEISDSEEKMPETALTNVEFLRIAAQTINRNYDGDPLALSAFINSIELIKDFATEALKPVFIKFIKSKLEGKALECIPTVVDNIDEIVNALREQIKPDNSKVIAGRMLALRVDRSKIVDFTQQAETLSEALQRSLIIEGISQAKAREMTIEKAVEVCRNAARSDLVKSVLAATPFESPKDVIAKFVVESATEYKEKQILAFKQQQRRGNNQRGRGSKFGKNFQNYRNSNGQYGTFNNFNGNGNYRGRGQGRGRGNGRGRGGNNNYNGNGYQEHYVRYAENAGGPSQSWRAEQQNQPEQGQFQIPYQRN